MGSQRVRHDWVTFTFTFSPEKWAYADAISKKKMGKEQVGVNSQEFCLDLLILSSLPEIKIEM